MPSPRRAAFLTGNTRVRDTWLTGPILQVLDRRPGGVLGIKPHWRDADSMDMYTLRFMAEHNRSFVTYHDQDASNRSSWAQWGDSGQMVG